jgi:hypothetical protein
MLKLSKQNRDEIVAYLRNVIVPSTVGANLIAVADILSKLEEIPEVKEDAKA